MVAPNDILKSFILTLICYLQGLWFRKLKLLKIWEFYRRENFFCDVTKGKWIRKEEKEVDRGEILEKNSFSESCSLVAGFQ